MIGVGWSLKERLKYGRFSSPMPQVTAYGTAEPPTERCQLRGLPWRRAVPFRKTGGEIEPLGKERPLRACECVVLRSAGGYFTFLMNRITTAPIVTAAMAIGNTKK
mgnify:CR=1 FL=1